VENGRKIKIKAKLYLTFPKKKGFFMSFKDVIFGI